MVYGIGIGIVPTVSVYQCQYTVYMVHGDGAVDTAAYWTRTHTHTRYYPTVHDHEHTLGALYTHRTEQTSKLRLAAGERRHL